MNVGNKITTSAAPAHNNETRTTGATEGLAWQKSKSRMRIAICCRLVWAGRDQYVARNPGAAFACIETADLFSLELLCQTAAWLLFLPHTTNANTNVH